METDNTLEQIDELCRKLDAEISQSEKHTARLKDRRTKLEAARSVFVEELGAKDLSRVSNVAQADEISTTLREAVLQVVKEANNPDGLSASEITNALVKRGIGSHVTPRVFYSMVYVSLMRLTESKELTFKKGPRGRVFVPYTPVKRVRLQIPGEHTTT